MEFVDTGNFFLEVKAADRDGVHPFVLTIMDKGETTLDSVQTDALTDSALLQRIENIYKLGRAKSLGLDNLGERLKSDLDNLDVPF